MTNIDTIRDRIPEFARDLSLNLSSVTSTRGAPGLSQEQILAITLACAIASRSTELASLVEADAAQTLDEGTLRAARAAAAIMGMNNVYYRFVHLAGQQHYGTLPARLRMNIISDPGVDKVDFELYCLVVSVINGCELCVRAHEGVLRKAGLSIEAIQSAVRIAAVIHAVAGVLDCSRARAA